MKTPLDPKRLEIARHITDARKLALELDAQILDYLLESALRETIGYNSAAWMDVIERLPDDPAA